MLLKIKLSVIFHFALLLYWDLTKMSKSIKFDFTLELGDPHAGIGKKSKKFLKSRTKGSKAERAGQKIRKQDVLPKAGQVASLHYGFNREMGG